jgi:hypothetical protein
VDPSNFDYLDCIVSLTFEPATYTALEQQIRRLADKFAVEDILIDNTVIDIEVRHPGDYTNIIRFLAHVAALAYKAEGFMKFTVSDVIGEPVWDSYLIKDGQLLCWREQVVRGEEVEITEITEKEKFPIYIAWYRGHFCFPNLTSSQTRAIENVLHAASMSKQLRDGCVDFEYLGRDGGRWYLKFLLDFSKIIGKDTLVEGEVEASIDLDNGTATYEFFRIENASLICQKGTVQKGTPRQIPTSKED